MILRTFEVEIPTKMGISGEGKPQIEEKMTFRFQGITTDFLRKFSPMFANISTKSIKGMTSEDAITSEFREQKVDMYSFFDEILKFCEVREKNVDFMVMQNFNSYEVLHGTLNLELFSVSALLNRIIQSFIEGKQLPSFESLGVLSILKGKEQKLEN